MAPPLALITLSGYPSSGKTTRAKQLVAFLNAQIAASSLPLKVAHINDESLHLSKSAYNDSRAEKPARATLFSAVTRNLAPGTIVVADAMNYIKGSRYQMYCNAREMLARTCTVYIAAPPDKCREWNALKPEEERYIEPTLENLISRFEEPSSAARWDAPLFTIATFDPPLYDEATGERSEVAVQIWNAITKGDVKPPNTATVIIPTSTTSYLTLLESTTTLLISTLLARQALSPLSGATPLLLPTTPPIKTSVNISRPVTMPLCQRLRRQFTKLNMSQATELPAERIASLFGEYLENAVQ